MMIASSAVGHDNDPKASTLPPIYGEIVYGDRDGLAGGFDSSGFIFGS